VGKQIKKGDLQTRKLRAKFHDVREQLQWRYPGTRRGKI
jgi:hypothetical protein